MKDEGVLEKFEVDLAEAQNMVMTARIMLGWVDPEELDSDVSETSNDETVQEG